MEASYGVVGHPAKGVLLQNNSQVTTHVYSYQINILTHLVFLETIRRITRSRLEVDLKLPGIIVVGGNHNCLCVLEGHSPSNRERFVQPFECAFTQLFAVGVLDLDQDLLDHTRGSSL
jgi:hypothetical protein